MSTTTVLSAPQLTLNTSVSSSFKHASPKKENKMSITQTYFLAHTARGKLSKEASRPDHNLRVLVGHANLLDSLMLDLSHAEQEQERWFNQTVSRASSASEEEPRHIQWADTIVEEPAEDWDPEDASDSDSDDEEDSDYEDILSAIPATGLRRTFAGTLITAREVDSDEDDDAASDDDEDFEDLALVRTSSRQQPPELLEDSDDESEEEETPPTPPQETFNSFSEKDRKAIVTTTFYDSPKSHLPASEARLFAPQYMMSPEQEPAMVEAY